MNYSLSNTISPDDKRQDLWSKQVDDRGFDDTEVWSLDKTIIKFLYPRLVVLRDLGHHTSPYKERLDKLVEMFGELHSDIDNVTNCKYQDEAFELLAELNGSLWD